MGLVQRIASDPVVHVRIAAGVALLLGLAAALMATSTTIGRLSLPGFTPLQFVDAAILIVLAFGMYRLSRICTVLVLVHWLANRIYVLVVFGVGNGPIEFVITVLFAMASLQVFTHHKNKRAAEAS